jgi:hypothetical protein
MTFYWKKLGQIYDLDKSHRHSKLLTHAANPLPIQLDGSVFRIFYSGRDEVNRSSIGAVDFDMDKLEVVQNHYEPFFLHGPSDSFFADGVSIGNFYCVNGSRYMLFMGWQAPPNSHWRGDIGRLIITPELNLKIESYKPFIDCNSIDPISLSYPWVSKRASIGYDMWYGSTLTWDAGNGEMLHVINHAFSENGETWERSGLAVPYTIGLAQAFSRPTVVQSNCGMLQMWFSYRGVGQKYRIGYATSSDGFDWKLELDKAGITTSENGWDSEMIEYPYVFDYRGDRYMIYNGNGYGINGFGLAILTNI